MLKSSHHLTNREAMYYHKEADRVVQCTLCPHACTIPEGESGICRVRKNIEGTLYASAYGVISAMALDPIEKKPLFKFYPGSQILSIGSVGCNLHCPFCQNYPISTEYENTDIILEQKTAEELVSCAIDAQEDGNIGLAYTYNEPLINFEFIYDCSKTIYKNRLRNILVTNGYINVEPLERLLPLLDAANVDLKSFRQTFYDQVGGQIEVVKRNIQRIAKSDCHLEITFLVIPDENDSDEEMEELCKWIASIDPQIPLHISRSFPLYKYTHKEATPHDTVYHLREIAWKYLEHVFIGNMGW